jgi:hypothetical protein
MRGVSEAAEALLNWYLNKGIEKPYVNPRMQHGCTVVEGFYVDRTTGVVCGRHLELDTNSGSAAPIYYYNRSWRFVGLFNNYDIALPDQTIALNYFEALEKVWEKEKENYARVYFLTQKVILQEICRRLCIPSSQPAKRPISDLRRYKAQIKIFNALWNIVLVNKYESTPRRRPTVLLPIRSR